MTSLCNYYPSKTWINEDTAWQAPVLQKLVLSAFHPALQEGPPCLEKRNANTVLQNTMQKYYGMFYCPLYLLALVDSLAVVLLDSLVFFFCWVAEGFRSSCSSGSGAGGSL